MSKLKIVRAAETMGEKKKSKIKEKCQPLETANG
jgi:hypothetical protein